MSLRVFAILRDSENDHVKITRVHTHSRSLRAHLHALQLQRGEELSVCMVSAASQPT